MRQKNCSLDTRHFIETLEARALFSAYVYGALNDEFDLPRVIHDLAPGLESLGYSNGIGIGDILVRFGGSAITDTDSLQLQLGANHVGVATPVTILRAGEPRDLSVTVGERS